MFGEPNFAAAAAPKLVLQHKVWSARNRLALTQRQLAGHLAPHRSARDRPVQPVANPGLGRNVNGIAFTQSTPKLVDGVGQDLFNRDAAGPNLAQELVLGHHLAGMAQQVFQDLQRAALDLDRQTGHAEFETGFVELGRAEDIGEVSAVHQQEYWPHHPVCKAARAEG